VGVAVTTLRAAISWSGTDVVLSLFVVWAIGGSGEIVPPSALTQPRLVRTYDLEDEADVLEGRRTSEFDLIFDDVPKDLDRLVEAWLVASIRSGGAVAWFGLEGSFDFEHLLADDVANQVYGVAGPDFIALATDDQLRRSDAWASRLAVARRALQCP
jgi:hypothetical protein